MNQIGLGEIHLWWIDLKESPQRIAELESLLAPDELAKADRFVTEELRNRYVIARGRLRELLSDSGAGDASDIQFGYQELGKPFLKPRDRAQRKLEFNVSHSGQLGLIGLGHAPLGVDVEVRNERVRYRTLIPQVLAPQEMEAWQAILPRDVEARFLPLWVGKEALLKAMGLGIAEGLRKVALPIPVPETPFHPAWIDPTLQLHLEESGSCRLNSWLDGDSWTIHRIPSPMGTEAAIATLARHNQIVVHGTDG